MSTLPDPAREIRIVAMHTVRGANYWSRRPVTRMDVQLGAYENISSADAPWMAIQLAAAIPELVEHRCSVGTRGGFLARLRDGTYAAHITEHVALELQSRVGHDTGYGRTRGTGVEGEYSVVLEHRHEATGRRAAELALEIVQRAFAGTLDSVEPEVEELRVVAATPNAPPIRDRVRAGIIGSAGRDMARDLLARDDMLDDASGACGIVNVAPAELLEYGLPYAHSDIAVVLDAAPVDVPPRYRDPERAARLVSVVADAVPPNGVVICPADAYLVHDIVRDAGRHVRTFAPSDDVCTRVRNAVRAARAVPLLAGDAHHAEV